jgi:glutathione S-transferase
MEAVFGENNFIHGETTLVRSLADFSAQSPFVQRVWIALEMKKIPYQYIEVDPYQKPQSLLEVNPRGLVPALRHDDWGCYESTVLMEYVRGISTC